MDEMRRFIIMAGLCCSNGRMDGHVKIGIGVCVCVCMALRESVFDICMSLQVSGEGMVWKWFWLALCDVVRKTYCTSLDHFFNWVTSYICREKRCSALVRREENRFGRATRANSAHLDMT